MVWTITFNNSPSINELVSRRVVTYEIWEVRRAQLLLVGLLLLFRLSCLSSNHNDRNVTTCNRCCVVPINRGCSDSTVTLVETLSPFLTGRMFVRRTYFGHFDELWFSSPNMVRTVQTLLRSQLACNVMQTCGRRAADSMIKNVG